MSNNNDAQSKRQTKIRKPVFYGVIIALAIMIAILSLPASLETAGKSLEQYFGPLALLVIFMLGIFHGLKPDEHTWPITIPYALAQENVRKGIIAALIFTSALTVVWTILSGIAAIIKGELVTEQITPVVDISTGIIMIAVASFILLRKDSKGSRPRRPSYRLIWIHGLTAAFGGDFVAILAYTVAFAGILVPAYLGWTLGLLFGLGSMMTQSLVALVAVRSSGFIERKLKSNLISEGSTYSLGFLGLFLILLGVYSII